MAMALPNSGKRFPKILSDFMQREGLTGPKAAERLDVRHQSLYNWLNGHCLPPSREAKRLAERMAMPELVGILDRARARARARRRQAVSA